MKGNTYTNETQKASPINNNNNNQEDSKLRALIKKMLLKPVKSSHQTPIPQPIGYLQKMQLK